MRYRLYSWCVLAVALGTVLSVQASQVYTRRIRISSGLFLGLKRDRPQQGAVTIRAQDGRELGQLRAAGSFLDLRDKGVYQLEFSPGSFDLNFAIIKSRASNGAYFLNLAREGAGPAPVVLRANGVWDGTKEGDIVVRAKEGQTLLDVKFASPER